MVVEGLSERTLVVSTLTGQFNVGPLLASDTIAELKRRIQRDAFSSSPGVRLLLEGADEELDADMRIGDVPQGVKLWCSALPPALVVDCGSLTSRVGLAGAEEAAIFPSVVGYPREETILLEKDVFVGAEALAKRKLLRILRPVEFGIVTDWTAMEHIWRRAFCNAGPFDAHELDVLLSEPPLYPKALREKTAQIMFKTFAVSRVYIAPSPVLVAYGLGESTAVVMELGHRGRYTTPVYEGFCLSHAIQRYERAGGYELVDEFVRALSNQGYSFTTTRGWELVRDMMERHCYVSLNYSLAASEICPVVDYALPDGQIISLGRELFEIPERLFSPYQFYHGDHWRASLQDDVNNSVIRLEPTLRELLLGNILVVGGCASFRGLSERLHVELAGIVTYAASQIRVIVPEHPSQAVWVGGSKLVISQALEQEGGWITSAAFEAEGPGVVP